MLCPRRDPAPGQVRRAARLRERRGPRAPLYASAAGATRVSGFREELVRVPPATLAARLSELVDAGILERRVLHTRPPAVEYTLTQQGKRFAPLLRELGRCGRGSTGH